MGSRFHLIKSEKFYTVDVFLIHTYIDEKRKVCINRVFNFLCNFSFHEMEFCDFYFWVVLKITKILKNRMARILNEIKEKLLYVLI